MSRERLSPSRIRRLSPGRIGGLLSTVAIVAALGTYGGGKPAPTPSPEGSLFQTFTPAETASPTPFPTMEVTPTPTMEPTPTPKKQFPYAGEFVNRGDTTKKVIYITVDDCWHAENVRKIMEIADKYGIKITFFPIGKVINPRRAPTKAQAQYIKDTYKMLVEDGHIIEDHTYAHTSIYPNTSKSVIKTDLRNQSNIVREDTGDSTYEENWARTYGGQGAIGGKYPNLGAAAEEEGMGILTWTISTGSTGTGATSQRSIDNIVRGLTKDKYRGNGVVILAHANSIDVGALETIIKYLLKHGYTPDTVNHLVPDPKTTCTFDTVLHPTVRLCKK